MNLRTMARTGAAAATLALFSTVGWADIKLAYIDTLSGPFANLGQGQLNHFHMAVDRINARGGVLGQKLEVLALDGKGSPQESLAAMRSGYEKGARFVFQGGSSSVAAALVDGVNKQVSRGGEPMVFLNFGAFDPDLTGVNCSFWHFRFSPNHDIIGKMLAQAIANNPASKKIFQISADYGSGHQAQRAFKKYLAAEARPDLQLVGDDLHPLGTVKDFSPYAAKMVAAGADTLVTTNFGNDLTLLVKAVKETGAPIKIFTLNGHSLGAPTTIGAAGVDTVFSISEWHANIPGTPTEKYANDFKKRFKEDFLSMRLTNAADMLAKAMTDAKSTDPLLVARTLEGMTYAGDVGEVRMRKEDHQLQQPEFLMTFAKVDGKTIKYDLENTGIGLRTVKKYSADQLDAPTACVMKRPD